MNPGIATGGLILALSASIACAQSIDRQTFIQDCLTVDAHIQANVSSARGDAPHPNPTKLCACLHDSLRNNLAADEFAYIALGQRAVLNTPAARQAERAAKNISRSKPSFLWGLAMFQLQSFIDETLVPFCDQTARPSYLTGRPGRRLMLGGDPLPDYGRPPAPAE